MLISFTSELVNVNPLKISDASLSGRLVYFIPGPYYSNIRLQRSTIYVVKFSIVNLFWSVYTVIRRPKTIVRKYFKVSTILNSYIYIVV